MSKTLERSIMELFPLMGRKLFKNHNHVRGQLNRILSTIYEKDGQAMTFYSEHLLISKPNLTKAVSSLIEQGLVRRDRNEQDRRTVNLFITDSGKNEVLIRKKEFLEMMKESLKHLSEADKRAFEDHLEGIHKILNKLEG